MTYKNLSTIYRTMFIITFCALVWSLYFVLEQNKRIQKLRSPSVTVMNKTLSQAAKSIDKIEKTSDSNKKIYVYRSMVLKIDTPNIVRETKTVFIRSIDTASIKIFALKNELAYYKKIDSEKSYTIAGLIKDTSKYIAQRRNLQVLVQNFDEVADKNQPQKYDEKISLLIAPAKTAFGQSKNFLRVENLYDSTSKASGSKYYDTFIRNTENNSFFGQFRVSNNLSKAGLSAFTAGAGLELKTGRFSTNFAWLWNVEHPQYNTSYLVLGGRFDIFRIRL